MPNPIDKCLIFEGCNSIGLVESASALAGSTQTNNLVFFDREFVIVSNFFPHSDWLFGIDHNFLVAFDGDNSGVAIRLKL